MFAESKHQQPTEFGVYPCIRSGASLPLLVGLIFTGLAGWSTEANAHWNDNFATIWGVVKDKETQQPIDGAKLFLDVSSVGHVPIRQEGGLPCCIMTYSVDGAFILGAWQSENYGGYSLSISAEGYKNWFQSNIDLAQYEDMFIYPELEKLPPPPPKVNYARLRQLSYSKAPYRRFDGRFRVRSAPANPELTIPKIWVLPSEDNQFVAQIEIKGSGLDTIEELGVYDEAGELVPNVKIDVSNASPESMVIEYQLRDQSSANLVRSIQLRAGEETFTVPMRHDFY